MAKLVIRKGRNAGAEYKLNADRLVMGRRSANPIPVLDPKSSREHAVIVRKGEQFFLRDLSKNGTFVNEQPAKKEGDGDGSPLKWGDKIRIGETVMEVVDEKSEPIPIEIPGYKILEKIGQGGMGTVYKARQLSMDRVVALKVLNDKYSSNREFVERFIREARAAGKLNHPNVIHVHDVSKANGLHYISMEFVDGSSVKELLRIDKTLPPAQVIDIGLQTAKALEFAHENNIIHRDIKPDNIMVTKDGVVKIADLGIAKSFDEDAPKETNARNRILGTPHYMAPEQALGKDIDHRVDIYSLGATLYHILTGTTPFSGTTAHEVLRAHIQESLPAIQEFNTTAPDALCFVIERMMAKLPERRYPNMTKLIEDLERAQKGADDIEQLEAGASTIMRAVDEKEAATTGKKRKRPVTEEVGTGVQAPVKKVGLYVGLAIVFIAVVVAVVLLARPPRKDSGTGNSGGSSSGGGSSGDDGGSKGARESSPEAIRLLNEAKDLLARDPAAKPAEDILRNIVNDYPTQPVKDEAQKLLDGIKATRSDTERRAAQKLLDDARAFEAENQNDPGKSAEIAKHFSDVMGYAQMQKDILDEAKRKKEEWERKVADVQAKAVDQAFANATRDADAALGQKDFDAARAPLKGFIGNFATTPQKDQAQKKLDEVEGEATRLFQMAQADATAREKDANKGFANAQAVWDAYLKTVKDSVNKANADKAVTELSGRTEKFFQDGSTKVVEAAKAFDYDEALKQNQKLLQKLSGCKFGDDVKARDLDLAAQRELHAKVLEHFEKNASSTPIPLPFEFDIKRFPEYKKWTIAGVANRTTLNLQAGGGGPGVPCKLADFSPVQLYEIFKLGLPTPDAADHKALAVFCKDRGLADQAAIHLEKAKLPPPP